MLKLNLFLSYTFFFLLPDKVLTSDGDPDTSAAISLIPRLMRVKNPQQPCALYSENSRDLKAKAFREQLTRKGQLTSLYDYDQNPSVPTSISQEYTTFSTIVDLFFGRTTKYINSPLKKKSDITNFAIISCRIDQSDWRKRHIAFETYAKRLNWTMANGTEVSERSNKIISTQSYATVDILKRNEEQTPSTEATKEPPQTPHENQLTNNQSNSSPSIELKTESTQSKRGTHVVYITLFPNDTSGSTIICPDEDQEESGNQKAVLTTTNPGKLINGKERLSGLATPEQQTLRTNSTVNDHISSSTTSSNSTTTSSSTTPNSSTTPSSLAVKTVLTKVFIIPIVEEVANTDLNNTLKSVQLALDKIRSADKKSDESKRTASKLCVQKNDKIRRGTKSKAPSKHKTNNKHETNNKKKYSAKKHNEKKKYDSTTKKQKLSKGKRKNSSKKPKDQKNEKKRKLNPKIKGDKTEKPGHKHGNSRKTKHQNKKIKNKKSTNTDSKKKSLKSKNKKAKS